MVVQNNEILQERNRKEREKVLGRNRVHKLVQILQLSYSAQLAQRDEFLRSDDRKQCTLFGTCQENLLEQQVGARHSLAESELEKQHETCTKSKSLKRDQKKSKKKKKKHGNPQHTLRISRQFAFSNRNRSFRSTEIVSTCFSLKYRKEADSVTLLLNNDDSFVFRVATFSSKVSRLVVITKMICGR
jgi:hypothetical protein